MATITEDYVSFETAKLLNDKGFNEPTLAYAYGNGMICYYSKPRITDILNIEAGKIPMPTIQMAIKWLREKHNIVVEPFIREDTKYVWYIHRIETKFNKKYLVFCWGSKNNKYERYEQACEAAIKYCLENLI